MGEPVSEVPTVYQNGFGARWEFDRGFWVKDGIVAAAGVRVENFAGHADTNVLTHQIETSGVEITIMSAERAKLPSSTRNSLD